VCGCVTRQSCIFSSLFLVIFSIFLVIISVRFLYQMNRCIAPLLILLTVSLAGFEIIGIMMSFKDNANGQTKWTFRESLLSLRQAAPKPGQRLRQHIATIGCVRPRRGCRAGWRARHRNTVLATTKTEIATPAKIPVIITTRSAFHYTSANHGQRQCAPSKILRPVIRQPSVPVVAENDNTTPWLYVINAAALSKPHAVEQLSVDLTNYNVDIAAVTETHHKAKHTDSVVAISGYALHRRDRTGRKGGGVAAYVRTSLQATQWIFLLTTARLNYCGLKLATFLWG